MKNVAIKLGLHTTLLISLSGMAMQAQTVPGPHPEYLHALTDLRAARHYLTDGKAWEPVKQDDEAAIREIDAAIDRIKQASIDDGKGLHDPFRIDMKLSPHDRFRKANELLYSAHNDLAKAEDVPQARDMRNKALGHVDKAHEIVDRVEKTAQWQ